MLMHVHCINKFVNSFLAEICDILWTLAHVLAQFHVACCMGIC